MVGLTCGAGTSTFLRMKFPFQFPLAVGSAFLLSFNGHAQPDVPEQIRTLGIRPRQDLITTATSEQVILSPTNRLELFNGNNLDGFTFTSRNTNTPVSETWTVTNGVIHCSGKTIGYLRTEKKFRDYKLTVEWRFVKLAPKLDNTGVLVHMQLPDKVWPMCVQNQGKSGRQGDLFVMSGAECKEHEGKDANTPVALRGEPNENAIGEWNTNVTLCASAEVKAIINGKTLNEITGCTVSSGFIGIQSEGAEFEIRKMFLEPVK